MNQPKPPGARIFSQKSAASRATATVAEG
jgi:hypothetical protein